MTSIETREKRRKKIRRDSIARELHSSKYAQRKLPKKRKGGRYDRSLQLGDDAEKS
jgi:hypothetical protein